MKFEKQIVYDSLNTNKSLNVHYNAICKIASGARDENLKRLLYIAMKDMNDSKFLKNRQLIDLADSQNESYVELMKYSRE